MAKSGGEEVRRCISLYFTQLQNVHPLITGEDLKKMNIPPGPVYRELLEAVLKARLDGRVASREDELNFVRRNIKM
jgi:tRNA nucleotidyltransferase (CCA-adding enzyme)